jgi:membrane-bound lytic murein transglycosylase D
MSSTTFLIASLAIAFAIPTRASDPVAPAAPAAAAVDEAMDAGDVPEVEKELEAQSAEINEVRLAEEKAALVPLPRPEDGAAREAVRLGTESPLRHRIDGALSRDTAPMPDEDVGSIALLPEIGHDLRRLQAEYDIPIDVNEAVVQYVRFFQVPSATRSATAPSCARRGFPRTPSTSP